MPTYNEITRVYEETPTGGLEPCDNPFVLVLREGFQVVGPFAGYWEAHGYKRDYALSDCWVVPLKALATVARVVE